MDIFWIFLNMKVFCVFSLDSPHQGDSNEYPQYTIFNIKRKITLNYPKIAAMGFFPRSETAMVNEPSVFEPLKFYCICKMYCKLINIKKRTFHVYTFAIKIVYKRIENLIGNTIIKLMFIMFLFTVFLWLKTEFFCFRSKRDLAL